MTGKVTSLPQHKHLSDVFAYAIGVSVFLLPLPIGGFVVWARSAFILSAMALFLVFYLQRQQTEDFAAESVKPWLMVWLAVCGYALIQLFLLPSPFPDSIFPTIDGESLSGPLYLLGSLDYLAIFSAYLSLAFISFRLSRRQVRIVIIFILLTATFQSAYGLYAASIQDVTILGIWERERFVGLAAGTFFNRNHFAGLIALTLPLFVAFFFLRHAPSAKSRHLRAMLGLGLVLLCGLALFGSHSRLGIIATFAGLIATAFLMAKRRGNTHISARWTIAAVLLVLLGWAVWLGLGDLITRFLALGNDANTRLHIWNAMLGAPIQQWIIGVGPGAFTDAFKLIQPVNSNSSFLRAHNEYLQFLYEFGVVGASIICLVSWQAIRASWPSKPGLYQLGAFGGIIAVGVHNIGDFDLQVPGTALAFWVILGIAFNPNLRSRKRWSNL